MPAAAEGMAMRTGLFARRTGGRRRGRITVRQPTWCVEPLEPLRFLALAPIGPEFMVNDPPYDSNNAVNAAIDFLLADRPLVDMHVAGDFVIARTMPRQ